MIRPTPPRLMLMLTLVAALTAVPGCKRSTSTTAAAPLGAERGDCRPDGGCDPGLDCRSRLCVRPPPADCAKVAEQVSFLLLDNYAPREQRDAFVAEIQKQCAAMYLAKDDGDCLVRATTRGELRACPRPLGIGDCARIKAHLEQVRGTTGVDAYLVTAADPMTERCRTEAPPPALEQCALAAKNLDDVERCTW